MMGTRWWAGWRPLRLARVARRKARDIAGMIAGRNREQACLRGDCARRILSRARQITRNEKQGCRARSRQLHSTFHESCKAAGGGCEPDHAPSSSEVTTPPKNGDWEWRAPRRRIPSEVLGITANWHGDRSGAHEVGVRYPPDARMPYSIEARHQRCQAAAVFRQKQMASGICPLLGPEGAPGCGA